MTRTQEKPNHGLIGQSLSQLILGAGRALATKIKPADEPSLDAVVTADPIVRAAPAIIAQETVATGEWTEAQQAELDLVMLSTFMGVAGILAMIGAAGAALT